MAKQRARSSHWLHQQWWRFSVAEWIGLSLGFLTIVLIFCLFFVRRHTLEYQLEHTFTVRDPEFFGSVLALSDPVPIGGNKIELLANGDEYFPAMLKAIRSAKQTVNFATYILHSDEIGRQFRDAFCERARAGVEVRILLDGIGSGWSLDNSDVRMMREAGCKVAYYHPTPFPADRPYKSPVASARSSL
jgi:cardiolipin synthase A/B